MKIYSIEPYDDYPQLAAFEADSLAEVRKIIKKRNLDAYQFRITQWDLDNIDLYDCPEIDGQLNLEVALDLGTVDV